MDDAIEYHTVHAASVNGNVVIIFIVWACGMAVGIVGCGVEFYVPIVYSGFTKLVVILNKNLYARVASLNIFWRLRLG